MKTLFIIILLFGMGCAAVQIAADGIAFEQAHARRLVKINLGMEE